MSKPTFMKVQHVSDNTLHYVDRREGDPTQFWNFYFEGYSIADRGEDYYVTGMLSLHDGEVVDFDGVFDLPDDVVAILKEMGYVCPWREE